METPAPKATPQNAVTIPVRGFLPFAEYTIATSGINTAYPISFIKDEIVAINITIKVNWIFDNFLIYFLEKASIKPVASATHNPINDINNIPRGAKLMKFFDALLIINFIPSNDNKFSTDTMVASNSFVVLFIVLYVACISNFDKIPLNNTTIKLNTINTVIGWK